MCAALIGRRREQVTSVSSMEVDITHQLPGRQNQLQTTDMNIFFHHVEVRNRYLLASLLHRKHVRPQPKSESQ